MTLSNGILRLKNYFIFFFLLTLIEAGHGQWLPQPAPATSDLNAISQNTNGVRFVCGADGVLLIQQPKEQTWALQVVADSLDLTDVVFPGIKVGFLSADSGVILKTSNGGENWQRLTTGIHTKLNTLFFTDSLHGWAAGDSGALIRTDDGGNSWLPITLPEKHAIYGLWFDAQAGGWCVGDSGMILRMENGSPIWQAVSPPVQANFRTIVFADSQTGWIAGDQGTILKTENGGASWEVVTTGTEYQWNALSQADSHTVWISGGKDAHGWFLRTLNNGYTWSEQTSALYTSFNDILFVNLSLGFAVGDSGKIFKTVTGGLSVINKIFLQTPRNGAVGLDTALTCVWQEDREASTYILQVATDSEFNQTVYQTSLAYPSSAVIHGLQTSRSYYWRVRAVNLLGNGPWSDVRSFTTKRKGPWLHAPVNKSGGVERRPELQWQDLNAPSYQIQIASDMDFSYLEVDETTADTVLVPEDLKFDRKYYWRVKALYGSEESYWSDIFTFTTLNGLNGWSKQWTGTSRMLCAASFLDNQTGIAVGTFGTVLKTTDGGAEWQNLPSGTDRHLEGVEFISQSIGIAVGWGGTILKSEDSGHTWQQIPSGVTTILRSVAFKDDQVGWAVGEKGVILKTSDGGDSWSVFYSDVDYEFYQVFFLDQSYGWIVGGNWSNMAYKPVVFRTTDGGTSWQTYALDGDDALRTVFFISHDTGWAGGTKGQIFRTSNGGVTWARKQSGKLYDIRSIYFNSSSQGWAVGSSGAGLFSEDGGSSWYPMETGTAYSLRQVVFTDSDHGWIIGNMGFVLKTATAGKQLIPAPAEPRNHAPGQEIALRLRWLSVSDAESYHLQVAQDERFANLIYENQNIYTSAVELPQLEQNRTYYWRIRSKYQGQNSGWSAVWNFHTAGAWQEMLSTTQRDLNAVVFSDALHGMAVGEQGTLLITEDGGRVWKQTSVPTDSRLHDALYVGSSLVWAVGDSGVVLKSTDGGATWHKSVLLEGVELTLLSTSGRDKIWVAGNHVSEKGSPFSGCLLAYTTDEGVHWTLLAPPSFYEIHDLDFVDARHGFLCGRGEEAGLLQTNDGGKTWHPVQKFTKEEIVQLQFVNEQIGFLFSASGDLYGTEDGGESWEKISHLSGGERLKRLAFLNAVKGVAVGNGLWLTTDGGKQWQQAFSDSVFNDCYFVDENQGWIVGPKGLILKTTSGGQLTDMESDRTDERPLSFWLGQNYPNPFNPMTTISYTVPTADDVELTVFNLLGQKVKELVNKRQNRGRYSVTFHADGLASGVYFYRLKIGTQFIQTKKMILIR